MVSLSWDLRNRTSVISNHNGGNPKLAKLYQGPDTRRLVFYVPLCRWFETQTFKLFTGISEFYVTPRVNKARQEAGS